MKSIFKKTKKTLTMKIKNKMLKLNTLAPGFNYKNKNGAVNKPKTGILL
ncbi:MULTISPECIES: hypothetical protein [Flavobacteriaceae]|uniref:Uncharacterized protein n=1 Tax=Lutibacter litoralis TaxID=321268 RepID=A0ABV5JXQ6_9FLAO|nr:MULTISPECIES: hypothetical protein [Flavobacteriaceae]GGK55955.1 hypothetical protein GCM10007963_25220 [Lutibacter litoralis]